MLIYLRKITNNDTKKQIETTSEAYTYFFDGKDDDIDGVVVNIENENGTASGTFRISKAAGNANSYRFSSERGEPTLAAFINDNTKYGFKADDILKIVKKNGKFSLSLIETTDENYDVWESMLVSKQNTVIISQESDKIDNDKQINYVTSIKNAFSMNRILFGAPGTGKSYMLNNEREILLGKGNEDDYERVTFHPDYSYANFVGTYKPIMVEDSFETISPLTETDVVSVLTDERKTAQEKYDLLYDKFKDEGLVTRLPLLLGIYTDESFETRKMDGSRSVGDNTVERNHGRAIRPYVNLSKPTKKKKDISYEYVPGPFMRVLVKALKNAMTDTPKPFLLIIEEINRANVAAVFGEVFQLLDRDSNGVSEYKIATTYDMRKYLSEKLEVDESQVKTIKIPNNMFIWATMNSADQGVFPMDTAFKRRWDFTYLGIDDSDEMIRGKYVYLAEDKSQKVEWNKLRKAINNFLAKCKINEDKQLGPYFISKNIVVPENGDEIDRDKFIKTFKNKVIMYLFEDAAKQKQSKLFEGCADKSNRYSEICKEFDIKGVGIFNSDIEADCDVEYINTTKSNSDN